MVVRPDNCVALRLANCVVDSASKSAIDSSPICMGVSRANLAKLNLAMSVDDSIPRPAGFSAPNWVLVSWPNSVELRALT